MSKKELVVIGGGAAGHHIAYTMRSSMDVTLIDPKTYWEVPMAFPRLLVKPDALPVRMSFGSFLSGVEHVQGRAVALSRDHVDVETVQGQKQVAFDYAVIATGSRYSDPLIKAEAISERDRVEQIAAAHVKIRNAKSVVVAGGGPVGVETASELKETFPELSVSLVHAANKFLENGPSRFAGWAKDELSSRGVNIILNDMVAEPSIGQQPSNGKVRLKNGRTLNTDFIVWAAGARATTDFVASSWPQLVESSGQLKVDRFLKLKGHPNIFVAGDVSNLPEGRLAIVASFHAASVVSNLKAILKGRELKPYQPKTPGKGLGKLMIVTLGRRDGLTSLPFGQFRASVLARNIKAKDMLVGKFRNALGLS